jgi:hypothetical protein
VLKISLPLVYYAFVAAWLNVFVFVGMSAGFLRTLRGVAFAIGGFNVKDFFAWGSGFSGAVMLALGAVIVLWPQWLM